MAKKSEAIAWGDARVTSIMGGPELMRWRRARGISRSVFAELADCSERTVATYEKADILPAGFLRPVTETVRLVTALEDLAGSRKALKKWLVTANGSLTGETPLSVVKNGKSDVLWNWAFQVRKRHPKKTEGSS